MDREQVKAEVLKMIQPFVRNSEAEQIDDNTKLVDDLKVNSARLVDIILEIEDRFSISIYDEETDALQTVGGAIDLIVAKTSKVAEQT